MAVAPRLLPARSFSFGNPSHGLRYRPRWRHALPRPPGPYATSARGQGSSAGVRLQALAPGSADTNIPSLLPPA
eukprot:13750651-Alexandrium_andersonii.AAC.1